MNINIVTNIDSPDIPSVVDIQGNTLREAFKAALANTAIFPDKSVMDKKNFSFEEALELDLNGKPYYSYEKGLDTELKDGDTMKIALIFLGGG